MKREPPPPPLSREELLARWRAGARTNRELHPEFYEWYDREAAYHRRMRRGNTIMLIGTLAAAAAQVALHFFNSR